MRLNKITQQWLRDARATHKECSQRIDAQWVTILFNHRCATQHAKPHTRRPRVLNTLESKLTRYNTNCNITRIMLSKHQTCIATALIALSLRRAHGDKAPPARPHRLADTTPLITAALMRAAIHTNAPPCARVACVCHPYACAHDAKQLRQPTSLRALGDFRTPPHTPTHHITRRHTRTDTTAIADMPPVHTISQRHTRPHTPKPRIQPHRRPRFHAYHPTPDTPPPCSSHARGASVNATPSLR